MKTLVVDNYDSFTYNLVQYLGEMGCEVEVVRNDQLRLRDLEVALPDAVVISPGPGTPAQAGVSLELLRHFSQLPILGVCLGHQCIAEAFGGRVVRAAELRHGKTSWIHHKGDRLFQDMPQPFEATRYHSLIVEQASLPQCLEVTAWTQDGTIMGLRHRQRPVWGVQFHPESILTRGGRRLLRNFLCCAS